MEILKLNKISDLVNEIFDEKYSLVDEAKSPTAVLVRSFDMKNGYELPSSVLAVGRAGAGVNNIPCDEYAKKGVVVFNTPGANANAVKELVVCALLLASRDVVGGYAYAQSLKGESEASKLVEKNKSKFGGNEILGKTIGIIGLGAIGRKVAEACVSLGMKVVGYDPYLNEQVKKMLPNGVETVDNVSDLYPVADFITLHIPYGANTKGFIGKDAFARMKNGVKLLNFARGELVDNTALFDAIEEKKVAKYVTDFVTADLIDKKEIITLPHLGASTIEAEDNCAIMASNQLKDYIENGNIKNSVNFPNLSLDKNGKNRITVGFIAVDSKLNEITCKVNDLVKVNSTTSSVKGEIGYAIFDTDDDATAVIDRLANVENVTKVRLI